MRPAAVSFLIVTILVIAVFGIFFVGHGAGHISGKCLAAVTQGIQCPDERDTLSSLAFHGDAFKNFSTAIFNGYFASGLFLFLTLLLAVGFRIINNTQPKQSLILAGNRRRKYLESYSFTHERKRIAWLAFHEHSPSFA